jgi:hypothetical protein
MHSEWADTVTSRFLFKSSSRRKTRGKIASFWLFADVADTAACILRCGWNALICLLHLQHLSNGCGTLRLGSLGPPRKVATDDASLSQIWGFNRCHIESLPSLRGS